jgi:hypothetical protein
MLACTCGQQAGTCWPVSLAQLGQLIDADDGQQLQFVCQFLPCLPDHALLLPPASATCACFSSLCREFGVVSYTLLMSTIEFKTLAMRGDMEAALALLPQVQDGLHKVTSYHHRAYHGSVCCNSCTGAIMVSACRIWKLAARMQERGQQECRSEGSKLRTAR